MTSSATPTDESTSGEPEGAPMATESTAAAEASDGAEAEARDASARAADASGDGAGEASADAGDPDADDGDDADGDDADDDAADSRSDGEDEGLRADAQVPHAPAAGRGRRAAAADDAAAAAADAPDDDDDDHDDASADAGTERARSPWRISPVQIAVAVVVVVAHWGLRGWEPPPPAEAGMVGVIGISLGTYVAFLAADWWQNLARLVAAGVTVVGWGFIAMFEHFRWTPPTVFLCLGWLAVVESALFLWRTGNAATDDLPDDAAWWRPVGHLDELVREKRSLLKAIKEIEFDREMGKMTDEDAGQIVRMYRARAIEVIKALDALEGEAATSLRDEIEREVRARLEVAGTAGKKKKGKGAAKKPARARGDDS